MIREKIQAMIIFLLNDISDKFDAIALKSFVDSFFNISEKIIIHFPRILPFYINYYSDIIDQEINLLTITPSSSVLHIGCGSIPASSILLAKKTKAHVLGIDRDVHAIKNARICIKNMGLSDRIDIQKIDALEMDLSPYHIILISQGIIPKQIFLQNLSKNLLPEHIILLRSFSQDNTLDVSDQFLKSLYTIVQITSHKKHGSTTSIVLKKKQSS